MKAFLKLKTVAFNTQEAQATRKEFENQNSFLTLEEDFDSKLSFPRNLFC